MEHLIEELCCKEGIDYMVKKILVVLAGFVGGSIVLLTVSLLTRSILGNWIGLMLGLLLWGWVIARQRFTVQEIKSFLGGKRRLIIVVVILLCVALQNIHFLYDQNIDVRTIEASGSSSSIVRYLRQENENFTKTRNASLPYRDAKWKLSSVEKRNLGIASVLELEYYRSGIVESEAYLVFLGQIWKANVLTKILPRNF